MLVLESSRARDSLHTKLKRLLTPSPSIGEFACIAPSASCSS